MFRFGDRTVQSLGVAVVYFYASTGKRISHESDVINFDVPALIGLSLLFASESNILLKEKKLVSPHWSVDLVFKQGHLFIEPRSSHQVMHSKDTLDTFHNKLGHSNTESTERFLSMAKPHSLAESDKALLKEGVEECTVREKFGPRPRRQKALIPANVVYNNEVAIDSTPSMDFLPYVCSSTTYVASQFLESRKSSVIWDTCMRIWVLKYAGAPSVVRLDASGEHTSQEFRELAASSGI
jgi:hypothetical protein